MAETINETMTGAKAGIGTEPESGTDPVNVKDKQSRKWQLTINNPKDHGFTHEKIKELVSTFKSVIYWCMSDEIGENGTYHTHVFLFSRSGIRFSTIKRSFGVAHIEMAVGTCQQNMEYVSKTGKWEKDKKHETSVDGTFEEHGEMPVERQGRRNDLDDLYSMIKEGMSDFQILEQGSDYMLNLETISRTRQIIIQEKYKQEFRHLDVTYIWGETGAGKTRGVMESHGYLNVFRVTDYQHPFDNYSGQDVVLFDEFRSDLYLKDMLKYLDGYPLELPCRYANKFACYTKVYIVSNSPLGSQYRNIQSEDYDSWLAFLRRINHLKQYVDGRIKESHIELSSSGWRFVLDGEAPIPFEVHV